MHILFFLLKSEKCVMEKNKDWILEVYLITGNLVLNSHWLNYWKWVVSLKILFISSYEEARGLHSWINACIFMDKCLSCHWFLASNIFMIIKFSKCCEKGKCSCGRWPACRLLYLYMKQVKAKAIFPLTFFFNKKSFLILKFIFKSRCQSSV